MTEEEYQELLARVEALESTTATLTETTLPALTSAVESLTAAVTELQNERVNTYSLAYSGQTVDDAVGLVDDLTVTAAKINTVTNNFFGVTYPAMIINQAIAKVQSMTTADKINGAANRAYPLVLKWGVITTSEYTFSSDSGTQWVSGTKDVLPQTLAGASVICVCDWANTHWKNAQVKYRLNKQTLEWGIMIEHDGSDSSQRGRFTFRLYWIAVAKNSGGGSIG